MKKLALCLLWHQHQPLYRELDAEPRGAYRLPWVRLHALRNYYSMAALAAELEATRVTINLTPVLAWQIDDHANRLATDRSLELTLKRAELLTDSEQQELLATFFRAHPRTQIGRWKRYEELWTRRQDGRAFGAQDLRDLQAWFSLCWFASEFQTGEVRLVTGESASVRRFVERGSAFNHADVEDIVVEQHKILRAILPLHRALQEQGRIEVSTTPFYHPILPLLIEGNAAAEAEAQVRLAVSYYERTFGRPPRGMWPAEGAVSQPALALLAAHGLHWIATDQNVLRRSGRWGYRDDDPNVLCRPYHGEGGASDLALFFRSREISNGIGFEYHGYPDPEHAASHLLERIRDRIVSRLDPREDHVLTIALDGENTWGAYEDGGQGFLRALYRKLADDPEITTSTFSGYVRGDSAARVTAHPTNQQWRVHDLRAGSWVDDDFATWIGDADENRAWALLRQARETIEGAGHTPAGTPPAFEALRAAEGSDWFWWFGDDQGTSWDPELDALFRGHLRRAYLSAGLMAPPALDVPIAARLREKAS